LTGELNPLVSTCDDRKFQFTIFKNGELEFSGVESTGKNGELEFSVITSPLSG
jgi:hypothetical protein